MFLPKLLYQEIVVILPFKDFCCMNKSISILNTFKPSVPKRYLLFVAAMVWTFAGGMLFFRGFLALKFNTLGVLEEEGASIVLGIVFYVFMFSRISLKHIQRMKNNTNEYPCVFSFFNWRSYILMSIMISMGVTLRLTGIVPIQYLSLFYICMGTPLLLSSLRFYIHGFKSVMDTSK